MSISLDPSASLFQASPIKDPKDLTPYRRWLVEIAYAEAELQKFHERGKGVVRRYLDERDAIDQMQKWFNLFHANTDILKSALYAQLPKPVVSRRFKDYQDDVARVAGTILERSLARDLDDPRDTFDGVMRHSVEDRLLPGMGTCWIRLETDTTDEPLDENGTPQHETSLEIAPEPGEGLGEGNEAAPNHGFKTSLAPDSQAEAQAAGVQTFKRITDQRVTVDYVFWQDFIYSPCRVWDERRWVGRKAYLTREELVRRFGKEKGEAVPLNYKPKDYLTVPSGVTPTHEALSKGVIYEIWDRNERKVYWLCKDYPELLDEKDDPLQLVGFEPCPMPMFANLTTSNCVARPDFFLLQDQYNELDTINNRISMLVKACKVCGVYDRSAEGVQRMLQEGFDNTLIPVDNWAAFAEKGGVKGQVDWLPLDMVMAAMERLYAAREAVKQQIYEMTGIADIIRGQSKASETLGAQQIKAQFASIRIKTLQDQVAQFATEILRIRAEIMVKHFDPYILLKRSNILAVEPEQLVAQAIALLQSEEGFEWRVEITADSLAQADYAMEKQDRIEFLSTVTPFLEKAGQMAQAVPESAPLLVGMLKWAAAAFRNTAEIETMLDQALDGLQKNPAQPKPDPKAQAEQQKAQVLQMKVQADAAKTQQEMAQSQQTHALDMQAKQTDVAAKRTTAQIQVQAAQRKAAIDERKSQMDFNKTVAEYAMQIVNPPQAGRNREQ